MLKIVYVEYSMFILLYVWSWCEFILKENMLFFNFNFSLKVYIFDNKKDNYFK